MYPKYILACSIWDRPALGCAAGSTGWPTKRAGLACWTWAAAKASWRCCSRAAALRSPE